MNYPKRLIEVDLPIKRISAHARREKSIRHGHISTLHIWWARRPLAACRAVILASLWPDPADPACPIEFLNAAQRSMQEWTTHERQILLSPESRRRFDGARKNPALFDDPVELRGALLDFIADFSNWDNSTDSNYLATSRSLTLVAHVALGGAPGSHPIILDPFAGGGSIPLEALRIGSRSIEMLSSHCPFSSSRARHNHNGLISLEISPFSFHPDPLNLGTRFYSQNTAC